MQGHEHALLHAVRLCLICVLPLPQQAFSGGQGPHLGTQGYFSMSSCPSVFTTLELNTLDERQGGE